MKLKSIEIIGLNGSEVPIYLDFNDDLNIITGRNGSGKTTILKLLWYVISGNFECIDNEITFDKIVSSTNNYRIELTKDNSPHIKFLEVPPFSFRIKLLESLNLTSKNDIPYCGSSLFFSTYRRVESALHPSFFDKKENPINEALNSLSKKLSNENHQFISHVGTEDIEHLLFKKYTEISEDINQQQERLNKQLVDKISQSDDETATLKEIKQQIEALEQQRQEKMQPFTALKEVLKKFFQDKKVNIGDVETLSLGNPKQGINSSLLSAGEKQILSFFVYNAFYQDTIFIIDEPEINLHGDWQRMLVPTLLKQNSSNQFILATHSPFIYANYPDKEVPLNIYRGQND